MSRKNKFGIEAPEVKTMTPRVRSVGPMGAAVREAAEDLHATTEAKIEQRKKNAEDAKAYRAAQSEGRVLVSIPIGEIKTDELPRDRMDLERVATSDEMEELKTSIRARGQKEPIELFRDATGGLQLKKGWRRLTALTQLFEETRDDAFATITARIDEAKAGMLDRYIDMVEENVVREDLSFAEMAQVALEAAEDPAVDETDPDVLVNQLYASLHKMKRSYVRSFVYLLTELGDSLRFPQAVSRNLGVRAARKLQRGEGADRLKKKLALAGDALMQAAVLTHYLDDENDKPKKPTKRTLTRANEKFEFRVGDTKVTARNGECRIVSGEDFTAVSRDRLERAVYAFEQALGEE